MGFLHNRIVGIGGWLLRLPVMVLSLSFAVFIFAAPVLAGPGFSGPAFAVAQPLPVLDVVVYQDASDLTAGVGMLPKAVKAYLDASGLAYKTRLVPWTRLAMRGLNKDRSLIVDLLRTPQRESAYHWLLQLDGTPLHLIGSDKLIGANIGNAALVAGGFRAICEAHSAQCGMFADMGFPENRIFQVFDKPDSELAKLVLAGRADFMIGRFPSLQSALAATGSSAKGLAALKEISHVGLYLAAYKTLNAALLEQLQGED